MEESCKRNHGKGIMEGESWQRLKSEGWNGVWGWNLEAGGWKLEAEGWRLGAEI
jgi:hypothetical protein